MHDSGVGGPQNLSNEPVRGVVYRQITDTYVPSEGQILPKILTSRRMELLLIFHGSSALFWMKCFQVQGLGDMVQEVGQQDHPT